MGMTKKQKTQTINPSKLPTKKSINLATVGVKKMKYGLLIPLLIVVLAAAVALAKFAVIDRMNALAKEKAEVARLEKEIAAGYEKIETFGELTEQYAHYTFSGMTEDELTRADRVAAIELIRRVVSPSAEVTAWDLTGNELVLTLKSETLQEINVIAQAIEAEEIVDFCTVTTASTHDSQYKTEESSDNRVTAKIIVYLNEAKREVTL